jgi:hypothetical protein
MSSFQRRLATIAGIEHVAIACAAHLKSQLSEFEGLRERVRKTLEIASPETAHGANLPLTLSLKSGHELAASQY